MAGGATDEAARLLPSAPWARRTTVPALSPRLLPWNLGTGEAEVLSLAQSLPGYRAIVDDAAARACARTLGIRIVGTGGVLVLAKRCGLLDSVTKALQALRDAGLWLSPNVERLLIEQAAE